MSSGEESYSTAVSCSAASPVLPERQGSNFLTMVNMLSQPQLSAMADRTHHSSDQDKSSSQRDSVKSSLSYEDFNPGGLYTEDKGKSQGSQHPLALPPTVGGQTTTGSSQQALGFLQGWMHYILQFMDAYHKLEELTGTQRIV